MSPEKNKIEEILSSEKMVETIRGLVEDYGLDKEIKEEEQVAKELKEAEDPLEKSGTKLIFSEKIKKELEAGKSLDDITPFRRLRKLIKELLEKKLSYSDLQSLLQDQFGLSLKDAKSLTKDIENRFSFLLKREEFVASQGKIKKPEEGEEKPPDTPEDEKPEVETEEREEQEKREIRRKDSYRESIE